MAPPRKHDTSLILDATRAIVLRDGPRAASVAAIARESGAPVGTLYHRFGSRDGVLAAAWLRALEGFQERALAAADHPEPLEAAVQMSQAHVAFAREQPDDALLLLCVRRDDLLDSDPDASFSARLDVINEPLLAALQHLARNLGGRAGSRAMDAVVRAVVDLPNAAVRRHMRDRGALPAWLEDDIGAAARALLVAIDRPVTRPASGRSRPGSR
jgi:AcrR family transcriptional regulator